MIQLLTRRAGALGAVEHDLQYWGLPTEQVLELRDSPVERAAQCITAALTCGIDVAKLRFHEPLQLDFETYFRLVLPTLLRGNIPAVATSMRHTIARYGWRREMMTAFLDVCLELARSLLQRWSH